MQRCQTKPPCMVRRRSTARFRNGAPGGLHVSVGTIFTFALTSGRAIRVRGVASVVLAADGACGRVFAGCGHAGAVWRGLRWGAGGCGRGCRLLRWRGCEAGEDCPVAFAGFRRQAACCAAGVVLLAGVPGGEDPLVADDEQRRGEQHQWRPATSVDSDHTRITGHRRNSDGDEVPEVRRRL